MLNRVKQFAGFCGLAMLTALLAAATEAPEDADAIEELPIIISDPKNISTTSAEPVTFICRGRGDQLFWQVRTAQDQNFTSLALHPLTVADNVVEYTESGGGTLLAGTLTLYPENTPFQESLFRCVMSFGNRQVSSEAATLCLCHDTKPITVNAYFDGPRIAMGWTKGDMASCCPNGAVKYSLDIHDISEGREVDHWSPVLCCQLMISRPFSPCHRYRIAITPETEDDIGETADVEVSRPGSFFNITRVYATRNDDTGQYTIQVILRRKPGTPQRICPQILIVEHGGDTDEHEFNHQFRHPLQYQLSFDVEPEWRRNKYPVKVTLVNEYDKTQYQYQTILDLPATVPLLPASNDAAPSYPDNTYPESEPEPAAPPLAVIGLLSMSAMAIFSCYTGLPCRLMRCR